MTHFEANDLDWLAFRYIAGELSDDQRLAFENCLAEDQAAREALATAVELTEVLMVTKGDVELSTPVTTIPATVQLPARGTWLKPAAWMSAGAAACLVAVLISQTMNGWQREEIKTVDQNNVDQKFISDRDQSLALVWSQTRHLEQSPVIADDLTDADSDDMVDPMELTVGQPLVSSPAKTPSWIVAAVSAHSETSPSKSETDDDTEDL